jgi:serine protease Do
MRSLFRYFVLFCLVALVRELIRSPEVDGSRRPPVVISKPKPAPLPSSDRSAPPLPPPSFTDPLVVVEFDRKSGSSSGSAFAMHESGVWMTARHVVDGCSLVAMRDRNGWAQISVSWTHPYADMAIVHARAAPGHFALTDARIAYDQHGYAFGYPNGRPGSVYGRLIGRTRMRAPGLYEGTAASLSWADVAREPDIRGSLGGISGGPLLNDDGTVLGIIVAETPRRGRFETVAPEVLRAVSNDPQLLPASQETAISASLDARNFGQIGDLLRRQLTIAQVGCVTN